MISNENFCWFIAQGSSVNPFQLTMIVGEGIQINCDQDENIIVYFKYKRIDYEGDK